MPSRRRLLGAALAPALLLRAAPRRRPNIVVLLADDQRHDTIRALGNPEIRTPTLDRLAQAGTAYTHAFIMGGTSGAVCIPSRAMLLSGQTLFRADRDLMGPSAPETAVTFPELLGRNGYVTFATGKWHNSRRLFARSFRDGENIFFGGMTDQNRVPVYNFDPRGRYPRESERVEQRFSTELFTDSAISFLRSYRGVDPFLLYVAYTAPHDPRTPPREFHYSPEAVTPPRNLMPRHPFDNGEMEIRDERLAPWPRTPELIRRHLADYYGMISHLDAQLGRLLKTLEDSGRARDTYVVFAGDNGLALGQHGLMGKQNLYEHSVRVPLLVSGPGITRAKRDDSLVYLYDLYPTFCQWAGVNVPQSVEGRGLEVKREEVFLAYRHLMRGLRSERWKLIRYHGGQTQLFDLLADPLEMTNLAERRRGVVRDLNRQMDRWMAMTADPNAADFATPER